MEAIGPGDFALLRVVNEGSGVPVFLMLGKMHRNMCQCWLFPHLVIILLLFDLLSFPFRCLLCRRKSGRLLLRYQLRHRPDVALVDDLITDIELGPALSKNHLALDVVVPNGQRQDVPSASLGAMQSLLTTKDPTGFIERSYSYVTPKFLEPRTCPAQRVETVKAAALRLTAETLKTTAEETGAESSVKWVQCYIHFDGRAPCYFLDWQWGTWFWYTGRRYAMPVGFILMMFALLCNLADLATAPVMGIMYLLMGKSVLQCDSEGKHEVKAYLYTQDQGGEGVEHKIEGYMAVLRSDYQGPNYITGFNKCCRGSYQRWAKAEIMRNFEVPQEVNLYQDYGSYHMTPALELITCEEMRQKIQGIQPTCSCCC